MTWGERASATLLQLAAKGEDFSADDLLELVGPPDVSRAPNGRNNAVGVVFSRAAHAGLIVTVGYTRSSTPTRKGGLIRLWRGV